MKAQSIYHTQYNLPRIYLHHCIGNETIYSIISHDDAYKNKSKIIVAEGQGNTVRLIVFVYSDQISTIISNKIK